MQIKIIKCDICGKDMTNLPCLDGHKLTLEENDNGVWKALDLCVECQTKIVADTLANKDLSYLKNSNKTRRLYFYC